MAVSVFASLNTKTPQPKPQSKYAGQSIKPLPIQILSVGKPRTPGVQLTIDHYITKLNHYAPAAEVKLKSNPKNSRDVTTQVDNEEMGFLNYIKNEDWVVVLDENGVDLTSEGMADLIGEAGVSTGGGARLLFCVGGAYGHGKKLKGRANLVVKLSSLVMNHEVALVVVVEQLYRAWTILKGQNYHH